LPKDSLAKQVIVGATIPHAFEEIQMVDVSLGGTIRPIMEQRCRNSFIILIQTRREIALKTN
jgi:hypothetical protein